MNLLKELKEWITQQESKETPAEQKQADNPVETPQVEPALLETKEAEKIDSVEKTEDNPPNPPQEKTVEQAVEEYMKANAMQVPPVSRNRAPVNPASVKNAEITAQLQSYFDNRYGKDAVKLDASDVVEFDQSGMALELNSF